MSGGETYWAILQDCARRTARKAIVLVNLSKIGTRLVHGRFSVNALIVVGVLMSDEGLRRDSRIGPGWAGIMCSRRCWGRSGDAAAGRVQNW